MKKLMTAVLFAGLLLSGCAQQPQQNAAAVSHKNYPAVSVSPALEPEAQYLTQAVLDCSAEEALKYILPSSSTKQAETEFLDGKSALMIAYQSELGKDVEWAALGADALVFAADPDCTVDSLTMQQIRDIYSGTITNWEQLGGEDEEIVIRHRTKGSASRAALERAVPLKAEQGSEYARSGRLYYMTYSEYQTAAEDSLKLLRVDGALPAENGYAFPMPYGAAVRRDAERNSPERVVFRWIQSEYADGDFPTADEEQ